jgi:transcription elongation factor Elf1
MGRPKGDYKKIPGSSRNTAMQRKECHICEEEFSISVEAILKVEFENGAFTCKDCSNKYAEGCYDPKGLLDPESEVYTPFIPDTYAKIREHTNKEYRDRKDRLKSLGLFRDKKLDYGVPYPD